MGLPSARLLVEQHRVLLGRALPRRLAQLRSDGKPARHGRARQHRRDPAFDMRELLDVLALRSQPFAQPMQAMSAIEYSPQM
jgi:hypothetical protein